MQAGLPEIIFGRLFFLQVMPRNLPSFLRETLACIAALASRCYPALLML